MMPSSLYTHSTDQAKARLRVFGMATTAARTAAIAGGNTSHQTLATRCGAR